MKAIPALRPIRLAGIAFLLAVIPFSGCASSHADNTVSPWSTVSSNNDDYQGRGGASSGSTAASGVTNGFLKALASPSMASLLNGLKGK